MSGHEVVTELSVVGQRQTCCQRIMNECPIRGQVYFSVLRSIKVSNGIFAFNDSTLQVTPATTKYRSEFKLTRTDHNTPTTGKNF